MGTSLLPQGTWNTSPHKFSKSVPRDVLQQGCTTSARALPTVDQVLKDLNLWRWRHILHSKHHTLQPGILSQVNLFSPRLFSSEDENTRDWDSQHLPLKDKQSPHDPQEMVVSEPLGGGA